MTVGDLGWIALIALPIWLGAIALIWHLTTPRSKSFIQSSDAYGLPAQGASQTAIEDAFKESLRRSRARREADAEAAIKLYTRPKLGRWYGA